MKLTSFVPVCLLLLWALPDTEAADAIKVKSRGDVITLTSNNKEGYFKHDDEERQNLTLLYKDESSGVYRYFGKDKKEIEVHVLFQTCENCIELNIPTIAGLAIGDAVATILLGLAVYLIASQGDPGTSHKKSSERPYPNEVRNRASNDPYQRLRFNSGARKDTYDVINHNR